MMHNYSILFLKSVSFHVNPNSHICCFKVRILQKNVPNNQFSYPVQILMHTRHIHTVVVHCNHYDTLKISKDSSHKEIKSAYIKMAKKFHPDLNPGDPNAEKIFKEISTAYEILGNEMTKKEYDDNMIFNVHKSQSKQSQNMSEEEQRLRKKYPGYYARKDREAAEDERLRKKHPGYYARKDKKQAGNDDPFSTHDPLKKDETLANILHIQYSIFIGVTLLGVIWKYMHWKFKEERGKIIWKPDKYIFLYSNFQ